MPRVIVGCVNVNEFGQAEEALSIRESTSVPIQTAVSKC
jgi:hypothetical protein